MSYNFSRCYKYLWFGIQICRRLLSDVDERAGDGCDSGRVGRLHVHFHLRRIEHEGGAEA